MPEPVTVASSPVARLASRLVMAKRLFATAQILIVDDETANLRQLEQLLARAGYVNVRSARDPHTGLALFDALQPDLILLDLDMPHHDGLVLLGEIAARTPKDTYLPVLVLTGDATGTALRSALAAGANDSLAKPFDAKEVLLRIRNLLETRFLHQSLRKQNQEVTEAAAEAVSGVMADLIARRDLSVVAERIASSVRTLLQAQAGGVYQIDPATDELVALAVAGEVPVVPQRRLPKGAGIGGRAVQSGRPAVSRDFLTDPLIDLSDEARALLRKTPLRAALAVPLAVQGRIIGALSLYDKVGRVFTPEHVSVAQAFADQAAIALEMARVYDESEGARQDAEALAQVAKSLTETLDVAAIGEQVVAAATSLFHAQGCTLRLLEPGDVLRLVASGGPLSHTFEVPHDLPANMGAPGLMLREGKAFWTPDPLQDPRLVDTPELRERFLRSEMRAVLVVPLRVRGVLKGVLSIADRAGRSFSDAEVELLQMLADQAAVALENARHYQEVQQAYAELSRTHAQLAQAQRMESIGRLAGGIAHDFNNLLTVIVGRTALELARGNPDAALRKSLTLIDGTARRASALTRQLLAFSRKQVLAPQVLDLNAMVTGMEPILRRLIGEDITVVIEGDPELDRVKADPGQVEQVILNLAVNARDAMPAGGELRIKTTNTVLSAGDASLGVEPGPYVVLAVTDTGVGMGADVLSHIFEPFFTTKESGKGTGLGLSTVFGVVKQSGGHVTAESQVGHGTTFKVFLPRTEDELAPGEAPGAPAAPARGGETILLAEDADDVRDLAREILEAEGYRVLAVPSGAEALRRAEQFGPGIHLLLTDVVMPEMNGAELARRLAAIRPDLRVLFISGYTDDVIARTVIEDGTPLVNKPFTPATLIQRVRELLDD